MAFDGSLPVCLLCLAALCSIVTGVVDDPLNLLRTNTNGPTNEGTDFAVGYFMNAFTIDSRSVTVLYVGNTRSTAATVTVDLPHNSNFPGYPMTKTIAPNTREVFSFSSIGDNDIRVSDLTDRSKGIRVKSTNGVPVTVIGENDEGISADAFLALPCQQVTNNEYKYFIFSSGSTTGFNSEFLIVTCESGTDLRYTLPTRPETVLTGLDHYQTVLASRSSDLTGVVIVSNKPLAVFSGHVCGRIPGIVSACDHLVEQIPMHAVWGQNFLVVPYGIRRSGDILRVGSILDDNVVNFTCSRSGSNMPSFKTSTIRQSGSGNNFVDFRTVSLPPDTPSDNYRRDFCCIETSKPAIVMQYMLGHSTDEVNILGLGNGIGDPSISLVPPMEQYRNNIFLTANTEPTQTFSEYLSWAVPSNFFNPATDRNKFMLGDSALLPGSRSDHGSGGYIPIYCSNGLVCGYGAIAGLPATGGTMSYNSQQHPNAAFYSTVYGFAIESSFAYPGGFEMESIGIAHITVFEQTVMENVGSVTVEFRRTGGDLTLNSRISAFTQVSTAGRASAVSDFVHHPSQTIRWKKGKVEPATGGTNAPFIIQITNDEVSETTEYFEVAFTVLVNGYPAPGVARITIIDDDGTVRDRTNDCVITEPLMVRPFNATPSYSFGGTCELVAVKSCVGAEEGFTVRVDFILDTLANGAIGVYKDGFRWVSREDGGFLTTSKEVPKEDEGAMDYETSDITVLVNKSSKINTIIVGDGILVDIIHSYGEDKFIGISVSPDTSLQETCGICGTQQGELLNLNGGSIATTFEERLAFVSSYRVPVREQSLRPQRTECGILRNDSVIGDPLFIVPFNAAGERINLCFVIHGQANSIFNFISDECVNVNAYYAPAGDLNIISAIAVRAEGNSGNCRDIRVDLEGCAASMSPSGGGGGDLVPLGPNGRTQEDGISLRQYNNRVRIAVPNCDQAMLVMYVVCQRSARVDVPDMIRFSITRGVNLRPSSHGFLGQFWNIPVQVTHISGYQYNVTIQPANGSPPRFVLGEIFPRTWDNTRETCLYLGNSQGGRSGVDPNLDYSVIEGKYSNYRMDDMFATQFEFEEWDSDCTP